MTFYCKSCTNDFKIRWFYILKTNKNTYLASGLPQDVAAKYLLQLVDFIKHKIICIASESVDLVLANGLAQATLGVNLYALAQRLKDIEEVKCVYTPDVSAALKIYTNKGTVCVHSSGKILYMGCKIKNSHGFTSIYFINRKTLGRCTSIRYVLTRVNSCYGCTI